MRKLLLFLFIVSAFAIECSSQTDFDEYQAKIASVTIPFNCCIYNIDKLPQLDKEDFAFFLKGYNTEKLMKAEYELRVVGKFTVDDAHLGIIVSISNPKGTEAEYQLFTFSNDGKYRNNMVLAGTSVTANNADEVSEQECFIDKNLVISKKTATKNLKNASEVKNKVEYFGFDTDDNGDSIIVKVDKPEDAPAEEKPKKKAKGNDDDADDEDDE